MSAIPYTISIFEKLYEHIPPLVPKEVRDDLSRALEQVQNNLNLSLEELEDTMIVFGKKLWPYREAFEEIYHVHEGELGETFLLRKITPTMKKKYEEFKAQGGTYRDLHVGTDLSFFTTTEKHKLCEVLIDTQKELRHYTIQSVLSTEQKRYEKRIREFMKILEDMESRLSSLREMAEQEQEHPELAAEIREHIRSFEYGMCFLGPKVSYEAVCNAGDHFEGRKLHKKRHTNIL